MHKFIFMALAGLVMAGCASLPTYDAKLAASCQAYANTLYSLAAIKDEMTAQQITTVNNARMVLNPICISGDYQSAESALSLVEQYLAELNGIEVTQ